MLIKSKKAGEIYLCWLKYILGYGSLLVVFIRDIKSIIDLENSYYNDYLVMTAIFEKLIDFFGLSILVAIYAAVIVLYSEKKDNNYYILHYHNTMLVKYICGGCCILFFIVNAIMDLFHSAIYDNFYDAEDFLLWFIYFVIRLFIIIAFKDILGALADTIKEKNNVWIFNLYDKDISYEKNKINETKIYVKKSHDGNVYKEDIEENDIREKIKEGYQNYIKKFFTDLYGLNNVQIESEIKDILINNLYNQVKYDNNIIANNTIFVDTKDNDFNIEILVGDFNNWIERHNLFGTFTIYFMKNGVVDESIILQNN
ncbi:hypothetical protein SAMN02910289_02035 [Lachnospiraceae bacterium RM5]|nr:hypothetical protein SAMN02910289_02035 [Lachnospiraceae bacterium RM5]